MASHQVFDRPLNCPSTFPHSSLMSSVKLKHAVLKLEAQVEGRIGALPHSKTLSTTTRTDKEIATPAHKARSYKLYRGAFVSFSPSCLFGSNVRNVNRLVLPITL